MARFRWGTGLETVLEFVTEKAMAPHSSPLAWKISWTEEPGRLQSMGSQRVGWLSDFTFTFHFYALEKEMATHSSVLAWRIPGMGLHRGGHDWSDLAVAAAEFVKYLTPVCSERLGRLRCKHARHMCVLCVCHVIPVRVSLSSSHRTEGHRGGPDPLGEEAGWCDHSHCLLPECLCPGGPAALQGQSQEQMCQELHSCQRDSQLLLSWKTGVELLPWGPRSGWWGVWHLCIPVQTYILIPLSCWNASHELCFSLGPPILSCPMSLLQGNERSVQRQVILPLLEDAQGWGHSSASLLPRWDISPP